MKKIAFIVALAAIACVSLRSGGRRAGTDPASLAEAVAESVITSESMRREVSFLADTNITAGRGTGQIGYEIARDFLARELIDGGYEVTIQKFLAYELSSSGGRKDSVYSWNVIGFLRGGNADSSAVMFSAHADHDGVEGNIIFPGADDNASGVAAVLGIAKAFSILRNSGVALRKSIVICFFGAEETPRMEGSYYFVRSDYMRRLMPVVLMNFDMVGRGGSDSLAVLGVIHNRNFETESPTLFRLVRQSNMEHLVIVNTDSTAPDDVVKKFTGSFGRTDSWNFYLRDIPVLFFFTGIHRDYHQPTDTAEKLDYEKLARIARLGFRIGLHLAMNDIWPVINRDSVYVDLR